jgi:hypothetical protein
VGGAIQRDAAFLHRFEQRGLGLGRGAVDLVGQQQVAEDRPARQGELAGLEVEQVRSQNVARHQIGGELDAPEIKAQTGGEALRQKVLAVPGGPSSRTWPCASSAVSRASTVAVWPTALPTWPSGRQDC